MSAQSVSLVCHQCRRLAPLSTPPTKWSQNADGWSLMLPPTRYARPIRSVTVYVHPPPFETKSVTKNQPTTAEIRLMNGNLQRLRSFHAATRTSSSSERCDTDQPPKAEFQLSSHPNQCQAMATNAPHAITDAKANMPAATQRSRRPSDSAMTERTTSTSSAHAVSAPLP